MNIRSKILVPVALSAIAAAGASALTTGRASEASEATTAPRVAPSRADSSPPAATRLADAFGVLRAPSKAIDSGRASDLIRAAEEAAAGTARARKAEAPTTGSVVDAGRLRVAASNDDVTITVVPGPEEVCLSVRNKDGSGSLNCTTVASAIDPDSPLMAVDGTSDGRTRLTALLPDEITSAKVVTDDGTKEVGVTDNVVTVTTAKQPRTVVWVSKAGTKRTQSLPKGLTG